MFSNSYCPSFPVTATFTSEESEAFSNDTEIEGSGLPVASCIIPEIFPVLFCATTVRETKRNEQRINVFLIIMAIRLMIQE